MRTVDTLGARSAKPGRGLKQDNNTQFILICIRKFIFFCVRERERERILAKVKFMQMLRAK